MMNSIEARMVRRMLEEAGQTPYAYSGRGMYGDKCMAFDTNESVFAVVADLIREAARSEDQEAVDCLADALYSAKTDSMGLGTVLYFTDVPFVEDDSEEDEDEDEDSEEDHDSSGEDCCSP